MPNLRNVTPWGNNLISSDNVRRMQQELSLPGTMITRSQNRDVRNDLGYDLILSGSYLTIDDKIRSS